MAAHAQLSLLPESDLGEDSRFLEEQLITYIGNKRSLLPLIGQGLAQVKKELGKSGLDIVDLFSGTGVVARYMKQHASRLIVNDLESYSRVSNECYLTNRSDVDIGQLTQTAHRLHLDIEADLQAGFITDLYAPRDESNITREDRVFYTRRNAMYLDTARQRIAAFPPEHQKYYLAPLLAKASVHANTSGVFKGFYKSKEGVGQYGGSGRDALVRIKGDIRLTTPLFSRYECPVAVHQCDANDLVSTLPQVDVAYLDPPYNQHPYGSNYFMLNLLVDYRPPAEISSVSGIPTDWNRSRYNQRKEAEDALFHVIEECPAKYVMISYNSEGFIAHERFRARLSGLGAMTVLETPYNTFRGSRNLRERSIHVTEFLYLLRK